MNMEKVGIFTPTLFTLPLLIFGGGFFLYAFPLPQADTMAFRFLHMMRDSPMSYSEGGA
jgi:hypothetical protein